MPVAKVLKRVAKKHGSEMARKVAKNLKKKREAEKLLSEMERSKALGRRKATKEAIEKIRKKKRDALKKMEEKRAALEVGLTAGGEGGRAVKSVVYGEVRTRAKKKAEERKRSVAARKKK